jgi:hypothetical protein
LNSTKPLDLRSVISAALGPVRNVDMEAGPILSLWRFQSH